MAATRKKPAAARRARPANRKAAQPQPQLTGIASDIVGIALGVLALAMAVALLLPTTAPVTRAAGDGLTLLFGAGALLVPVSLLVFALTFFMRSSERISGRVALGLALITLSVLSIVSITCPGAETDAGVVLQQELLRSRGGYVGGGIAWALLTTVGREVGLVVLGGMIVVGIVVCGFSVSDALVQLRAGIGSTAAGLQKAGAQYRAHREERRAARETKRLYAYAYDDYDARDGYEPYEPAEQPNTTYIGTRKTTVLTRSIVEAEQARREAQRANVAPTIRREDMAANAETTLLPGRRKARPTKAEQPSSEPKQATIDWQPDADDASAHKEDAVPDFLRQAAEKSETPAPGRRRASTSRRTRSSKTSSSGRSKTARGSQGQGVADASVRLNEQVMPERPGDADETYSLPPLSMLSSNPQSATSASSKAEIDQTMEKLQGTLHEFGLMSRVVDYISGPLVTTFRIEMGEGERVNRIRSLEDDIALTLAAEKVRIFAPITGTSYVGIEIPNKTRQNVHLGDVLPYAKGGPLEVAIGRDSAGNPVIADIAKMPHMLVAGTTGSGKSVMINSMIMSLLMRSTPKQVRLIMVDPKRVEFKGYNGIPHLYVPVVTEPRQAASALQWAVSEMERRLKVFERAGARNITVYNKMCVSGKLSQMDNPPDPMPYLVIVIDELSDLMMVAGKDVEASIVRIAQLARAAGIHLVIATQRPSANVVTGLIKSNIDSRVALKVSSGIDSRVILDETGADRLLGNGDMLFKDRGLAPKRVLGCYTSDPEIESVVDFIRDQGEPDYHEEILSAVVPGQPGGGGAPDEEDFDPLIWEAAQIVVESQLGSTSGLQRRLKVGYARAGRIMDMLESKGVVGPASGSKPREVLLDEEGLEDLRVQEEKYREV